MQDFLHILGIEVHKAVWLELKHIVCLKVRRCKAFNCSARFVIFSGFARCWLLALTLKLGHQAFHWPLLTHIIWIPIEQKIWISNRDQLKRVVFKLSVKLFVCLSDNSIMVVVVLLLCLFKLLNLLFLEVLHLLVLVLNCQHLLLVLRDQLCQSWLRLVVCSSANDICTSFISNFGISPGLKFR